MLLFLIHFKMVQIKYDQKQIIRKIIFNFLPTCANLEQSYIYGCKEGKGRKADTTFYKTPN